MNKKMKLIYTKTMEATYDRHQVSFLPVRGGDVVSSTRDQKKEVSYKYCTVKVWNSLWMLPTDSSKSPKALF